jgi:hypothetical protein
MQKLNISKTFNINHYLLPLGLAFCLIDFKVQNKKVEHLVMNLC